LSEWGLTPEWIFDNWTDEELTLMLDKLVARKLELAKAYQGKSIEPEKISDTEMFARLGNKIKKVKHGD
jgi:hypothetical protein